ncbi:MAG: alpha/beta hydrolase-fold protein [Clostridia bacterium]|nr:alpha/beta hydrolase-fold protein [Clostridia bacterium]
METQYFKFWSHNLGRDMEMKVYGHAGRPVLFIPCQDGHFYDFENFKMADVWSPWIDAGQVMVFAIDTIDTETWSNKGGDAGWRAWRHEQWMRYIADEVAPFIQRYTNEKNGWDGVPGIISFGCSLGATHAANLFFRYPDTFRGMLALSGIYTASYGFDGYMDQNVYNNSLVDYLANMSYGHPYIEKYNTGKGIICVGQGPWEMPESTRRVAEICGDKGINVWVDFWGSDCAHDWDWWYKQVKYYVPKLLG